MLKFTLVNDKVHISELGLIWHSGTADGINVDFMQWVGDVCNADRICSVLNVVRK